MTVSSAAPRRPAGRLAAWLARPLAPYYLVLGCTGLLVTLGLVMVLSASSVVSYAASGSSFTVVSKQALWVAVGLPVMVLAMRLPTRVYRMLGYPLLLASFALLLVVLVPHVGVLVGGARRWIQLPGGFQVQPSEPAKLALLVWGADLFARKERLLGDWRHLVLPLLPVTLALVALVMAEPDLGTTVVLLTIAVTLLWVVGAPGRIFAATGALCASGVGLLALTQPYRLARLVSFTHPFRDPRGSGYQAVQGLYALSSGGWWGLGLGASREKWAYLPNQYTDYIYAIIGEELGLVGALCVLALFAVLGYAGLQVARRSTDTFSRLLAAGITAWLISQALVNIGYVTGLLPVTGIPLPMVSFGGSSMVPTLFAVGMLAALARRTPDALRRAGGQPTRDQAAGGPRFGPVGR